MLPLMPYKPVIRQENRGCAVFLSWDGFNCITDQGASEGGKEWKRKLMTGRQPAIGYGRSADSWESP